MRDNANKATKVIKPLHLLVADNEICRSENCSSEAKHEEREIIRLRKCIVLRLLLVSI